VDMLSASIGIHSAPGRPTIVCSSSISLIIDRVAGEIIRLVVCVCVRVCPFAVGALLFEPFDLDFWHEAQP